MRLIDADELIERVKAAPIREKNKVIGLIHTERTAPCEKMIAYLDKEAYGQDFFMRGIRYAPVKRGRWEPHPSEREWDVCSYCHTGTKRREYGLNDDGIEWVTEQSYTYCPHCGARMENEL